MKDANFLDSYSSTRSQETSISVVIISQRQSKDSTCKDIGLISPTRSTTWVLESWKISSTLRTTSMKSSTSSLMAETRHKRNSCLMVVDSWAPMLSQSTISWRSVKLITSITPTPQTMETCQSTRHSDSGLVKRLSLIKACQLFSSGMSSHQFVSNTL